MHIQRHVKLRADLQLAQASATIGLRLLPARLASIALDRLEVVAGETATGTVSLSNPAPEGGAVVTISEAGTAAGLVTLTPERATVAAGESTQSFSVAAKEVSEKTQVVIQAAYQGEEKAVGLDLLPRSDAPQIAAVELDRSSIEGGKSVTGQVRLSGPARETVRVDLEVSQTLRRIASVQPDTVEITAGNDRARFRVQTRAVLPRNAIEVRAESGGAVRKAGQEILP